MDKEVISSPKKKILICGAGIGGLALGQYLKKYRSDEFDFDILEKDAEFKTRTQGYSLTVQTNGQSALEEIDKLSELKKLADAGEGMIGRGQLHYGIDTGDSSIKNKLRKYSEKDLYIYAPRQQIRRILYEGVEEKILWNRWVVEAKSNESGIAVIFGGGKEKEEKEYNCIIVCEGVFSQMRSSLLSNDLEYLGVVMLNGIVENKHYEQNASHVFSGDLKTRLFVKPFKKDMVMWQITISVDLKRAQEIIALDFESQLNIVLEKLQSLSELQMYSMVASTSKDTFKSTIMYMRQPLSHIDCSKLGLFTLLGDAAHPMPPFKGQGANQALLDAVQLGRLLNKDKIEDSLRVYERMMFKRANAVQGSSLDSFFKYHPKVSEIK